MRQFVRSCRLNLSCDCLIPNTFRGCRLSTSSDCSMPDTYSRCRAFRVQKALVRKLSGVVLRLRVVAVLWVGEISSLTSPTVYVKDTLNSCTWWCGVGVCGGVPVGVPHAPCTFVLARDKYIAPLNLQKVSSADIKGGSDE